MNSNLSLRMMGLILSLLPFGTAWGAGAGITYHGRLLKPNGSPVTAEVVQFRLQVRTPGAENCLLYQETHVVDLSETDGIFAITINDGTASQVNTEPFTLDRVFQNRGTFSFDPGKCAAGNTYAPNPVDGRKLVVEFNDGDFTGWEQLPSQTVNYVPMAMEAMTVGGYGQASLLRVHDGSGLPASIPALTNLQYNALTSLIAGTSPLYLTSGSSLNGANLSPGSVDDAKIASGISGAKIAGDISGRASGFTGGLTGDVVGGQASTSVVKLRGRDIDTAPPAAGQVLKWNGSTSRWEPSADDAGIATELDPTVPANLKDGVDWSEVSSKPATFAPSAHGHLFTDLQNGPSAYLDYRPNNVACATGETLKWNNSQSRWECAVDLGLASESDPSVAAFAKNAPSADFSTPSNVLTLSTVGPAKGGTGLTSTGSANQLLGTNAVGNAFEHKTLSAGSGLMITHAPNSVTVATNAELAGLSGLSANGFVKRTGAGTYSASSSLSLTTDATGVLPVANGGTGLSSLGNFMVMGTNVSGAVAPVAGTVNGSILQYSATGPAYSTAAYPSTTTANQLLYSSASNVVGGLSTANNAVLTTNASGVPSFRALVASDIPNLDAAKITTGTLATARLGSGTASGSTYLRGDGTWAAVPALADTSVTPGSYGSAGSVGTFTVDAQGRLTSAASTAIGNLNTSVLTAGTLAAARMPALTGDITTSAGTVATSLSATGVSAGTYRSVTVDAKGRVTAATNPTTIASYGITDAVVNGGNTGAVTVGTNDATSLTLETNNSPALTILSGGNVGIGTTSPGAKFHLSDLSGSQVGVVVESASVSSSNAASSLDLRSTGGSGQLAFGSSNYPDWGGPNSFNLIASTGAAATPGAITFNQYYSNAPHEIMRISAAGKVGIGTATPAAKLDVVGQIVPRQNTVASGATVDLDGGNHQVLSAVGGSSITLQNLRHGGSYTLLITDGTSRTYTFSGCATSHFKPANAATTAATHSIYSIMAFDVGGTTHCYIAWTTGW